MSGSMSSGMPCVACGKWTYPNSIHTCTPASVPNPTPTCATCRYWLAPSPHDLSFPWGTCRASHPADWRPTKPDDTCGVYDRKLPPRAD